MVIDYKEYYEKAKNRRNEYRKNKKLEIVLDKLYEWQIQEARNQAGEFKIVFTD